MNLVSIYPKINIINDGKTISFSDVMELVRTGAWDKEVAPLRDLVNAGATKKERDEYKAKVLNYFTASGTFSVRNDAGLLQHSGILALDFDEKENDFYDKGKLKAAWNIIIQDKYTHYAFLSCTATGICAMVHIDQSKHLDSFLFFERYYLKHYGLVLDKSCKDVSRPRFISSDPNLFTNPNYESLELAPNSAHGGLTTSIDSDEEKYDWVKSDMDRKHSYVEGQRHYYLITMAHYLNKVGVTESYTESRFASDFSDMGDDKEVMRAIKAAYKNTNDYGTFTISKKINELPEEFAAGTKEVYATAFAMNADGNKPDENLVTALCAQHCLPPNIVKGIFEHVYKNNKDEFGINHKPEIARVEVFIKKRWKLIKNVVTGRIQCRKDLPKNTAITKSSDVFDLVNEHNISRELMHAGFKFPLDKIRSLLDSDFVDEFNPFSDYFNNLPNWDAESEPDYINQLADFVTTDNQEFWRLQFKKALVRSIACAVDNIENRIVITLVGDKQETGKSNFIRFLCPPILKEYYTESELAAGEKDSDMQLSENFMWNLEELAALNNNEVNKLKATISKSSVKQRRAYDRHHNVNPRRVTFWASTNKLQFLADDSNTRWICFNVMGINHDYNNFKTGVCKVNITNVWTQAWALYRSGFNFNLTSEEGQQRDYLNKEYETSSTEKELIQKWFMTCTEENKHDGEFMTRTDILLKLRTIVDNKVNINDHAVSRALKQLEHLQGWHKDASGKTQRGYHVVQLSSATGIEHAQPKAPVKDWSAPADREDEIPYVAQGTNNTIVAPEGWNNNKPDAF